MFCAKCGADNTGSNKFCHKCGNDLKPQAVVDTRVRGSRALTVKRYAEGSTPGVALVLSFLMLGVGQFYNRDMKKGAVMLVGGIVLAPMTLGVGTLLIWVWGMVDAHQVAKQRWPLW
jgi:TM2 domain-containing membrane protein YozV